MISTIRAGRPWYRPGDPHGDKPRRYRRRPARSRLSTPGEKKARRNAVAPGDFGNLRARHQRLFDQPHLLVGRPPPSPLNAVKNLNPHQSTLKLALRSHGPRKAATNQGGAGRMGTHNVLNAHEKTRLCYLIWPIDWPICRPAKISSPRMRGDEAEAASR